METSNHSCDYKPLLIKVLNDNGVEISRYLIDGCRLSGTIELAHDKQKNDNGRNSEIWGRTKTTGTILYWSSRYMSDEGEYLTPVQIQELQKLTETITDDAKSMVQDYMDNPSILTGQVDTEKNLVKGDGVVVHSDSPILEDTDERKG